MQGTRKYPEAALAVIAAVMLIASVCLVSAPKFSGAVSARTSSPAEPAGTGVEPNIEWATCGGGVTRPSRTWYMAEGCTAKGYETWILVLNAEQEKAHVTLKFMTSTGQVEGLSLTIDPMSRATVNVADKVPGDYNVSTVAESSIPIVCERAMYSSDRGWAHSSVGATGTSTKWYMAEGCTLPPYKTWILVLNPGETSVKINTELNLFSGLCPGPVDTIPPRSRRSYNLADYAPDDDVATVVNASGGVVCERSTYASDQNWAQSSVGTTEASRDWYLTEGCTAEGFETWVLVQNPMGVDAHINIEFQTENGPVQGPRETLEGKKRKSYQVSYYLNTYNVSTRVTSDSPVVCERAMYAGDLTWAHSNIGKTEPSTEWYFAEGCTAFGFKTWVLLQNPSDKEADIDIEYMTDRGETVKDSRVLAPRSRLSLNAADKLPGAQGISTRVASSVPICAERAVYGCRKDAMIKPMEGAPIYPFTRDGSVACGHWPSGSDDYPYFGAPRANGRLHAGIDIYPPAGVGTPVYALKSGTVVRVEPFYTRYTGEVTYAVLVDHGDFVANYAEVQPPSLKPGDRVERGQSIGHISGTSQLHFEMYAPGTTNWIWWYGAQPANLQDPTGLMLELYNI